MNHKNNIFVCHLKVTKSSQVRIPQNAEPYFNRNWGSCNEHFIALYLFWLLNASIKNQNRKTNCGAIEKYQKEYKFQKYIKYF